MKVIKTRDGASKGTAAGTAAAVVHDVTPSFHVALRMPIHASPYHHVPTEAATSFPQVQ